MQCQVIRTIICIISGQRYSWGVCGQDTENQPRPHVFPLLKTYIAQVGFRATLFTDTQSKRKYFHESFHASVSIPLMSRVWFSSCLHMLKVHLCATLCMYLTSMFVYYSTHVSYKYVCLLLHICILQVCLCATAHMCIVQACLCSTPHTFLTRGSISSIKAYNTRFVTLLYMIDSFAPSSGYPICTFCWLSNCHNLGQPNFFPMEYWRLKMT